MLRRIGTYLFSLGPSIMLTLILGTAFIIYGLGLLIGYRSSLIEILGLPTWSYASMFIAGGVLKLAGWLFHWGRTSHTIGATIATFWSLVILVFSPSAAGWVAATPWIAIAAIAIMAAIWPPPFNSLTQVEVKELSPDLTDPSIRAAEFTNSVVRNHANDDPR